MSERRGCTEPRIWTPPLRELTRDTTLGYDVIDFAEQVLGMTLLPWQRWLLVHALEIVGDFDVDWHLRYRVVLVLVGRQSGKTFIGMLLALFFMYVLGVSLILGTAQDLSQAEEVWELAVQEATGNDELAAEIEQIFRGKGSKELRLEGFRRYKVATPNRRNTRGKSCDLVLMDELREHQTFEAWGAASKTIKARKSAVVWCMSNAGDGSSVVLRHLRMQAHKAIGDPDGAGDEDCSGEHIGIHTVGCDAGHLLQPSGRLSGSWVHNMSNRTFSGGKRPFGIGTRGDASAVAVEQFSEHDSGGMVAGSWVTDEDFSCLREVRRISQKEISAEIQQEAGYALAEQMLRYNMAGISLGDAAEIQTHAWHRESDGVRCIVKGDLLQADACQRRLNLFFRWEGLPFAMVSP